MPTIQVKPVSQVVQKWQTRASGAGQNYQDGINNPKGSQSGNAIAQANVWLEGVTQAGVTSYKRGLQASGDAKWKANSLAKGAPRYPQGITAAVPSYQTAMGQVLQVIGSVNLPSKLPSGNPGNMARVAAVADALAAAKKGGWSGGTR